MPTIEVSFARRSAPVLGFLALVGVAATGCSGAPDEGIGENTAAVSALSGSTIASIAKANVGLRACSTNSQGGRDYESSCVGNGGEPEYWCADFAQWVWQEAGANTKGLDAAAGSFYAYGQKNGTLHSTPSLGDAVVFNYEGGGSAEHVAVVVQVNANGTIETVSGDWDGSSGSEATFSSTSRVVLNSPAYAGTVGSRPGIIGMKISGFVSPVAGSGSSGAAPTPACIVSTTGQSGTCIDTSTCASQGGTSTAGFCPGADDVQCCTGVASGSAPSSAAPTTSGSGSSASASDAGSASASDSSAATGGCYSNTLGKELPNNACVQSASNDDWYQCDNGTWTDRWTDPDSCNGVYPL